MHTPRLFTTLGSFIAKRRKKRIHKAMARAKALYEMMRHDNPDLPTWEELLAARKLKSE